MRLRSLVATPHAIPLAKPYVIASGSTDAVDLVVVRVEGDDGTTGLGAATPAPEVTGETFDACRDALSPARLERLHGEDLGRFSALTRRVEAEWHQTPGAAAALDMALHDLRARALGLPLVELYGRAQSPLPTSVTIGILPRDETVAEAEAHVAKGFRVLKLKIGLDLDGDLERIASVREAVGAMPALRVDGNCGYRPQELPRLLAESTRHGVELVEQPCPPEADEALRTLPPAQRRILVADESIHSPADALRLIGGRPPFGGFVVKLMKCGGPTPARRIAAVAESAGLDLMWGCMDESAVGIAAALHAAYASPATRWLDLDGSFDLARDPAVGGFTLERGMLEVVAGPGLGAALAP